MAWGTKSKGLPKHDHDLGPMNAFKSPTCERCKINAETSGIKIHTCSHGGAFGRRDASCERCQQMTQGVNLETSLGKALKTKAAFEAARDKGIKEHDFAACSKKNVVCTCFDW